MSKLDDPKIFNNTQAVIEGWYWAFQSKEIKKGKIKALNFLGKELAVYRGEDGKVRAMDAYCPHMGAHMAVGKVEGNSTRCFFHHWKYNEEGNLTDIHCRRGIGGTNAKIQMYPTKERYGLIWIWTGTEATRDLPYVPELRDLEVDTSLGRPYKKDCHPNVMMINAIDAHHFYSVHKLPVELFLKPTTVDHHTLEFDNKTKVPKSNILTRLIGKFYKGPLTYSLCYHNATNGSVTLGPDFLHFYIMFATRPTADGGAQGQTILLTKKRRGLGRIFNRILLFATQIVGNYFATGDTEVFKTIRFKFSTPIPEDHAIIKFIQHTEKQKLADWGFGKVPDRSEVVKLEINPLLFNEMKQQEQKYEEINQ